MKPEIDEYELAVRARDGDSEALCALVERLRGRLFSIALSNLRNFHDAQDVTANAFVRICSHIGTLREPDRLRGWADGILRNEVRRLTANRRDVLPLHDFDAPSGGGEEPVRLKLDIRRALRRLPEAHAQTLSMFYLDGTPVADIASRMGEPVGTVKSRLHHGRKRLKTLLEEYGPMMRDTEVSNGAALKRALLVQATLTEQIMIDRLAKGLRRRGYELYIPSEDDQKMILDCYTSFDMDAERDWLTAFDAFVFDETQTPLPTIAQIVNIRAVPELRDKPIFVLIDDPLDATAPGTPSIEDLARFSMAFAYFNAGVDGVIVKSIPNSEDYLFSDERAVIRWDRITGRAGEVIRAAMAEAADLGTTLILPEHILIGITSVPDCLGAVLLAEFNGVDLEPFREAVVGALSTDAGANAEPEFAESTHEMLRQAQAEANSLGHGWLGAEHFLAGMLRMPGSTAFNLLTAAGLTLSTLREQIPVLIARERK